MLQTKLAQLHQAVAERNAQQLLRQAVTVEHYNGRLITIGGQQYLNFSGNDYLGLATAPEVLQAYADGALKYGAGSTGSPLITGQHTIHRQLTDTLSDWLGVERVLLFSSGFAANQAMLQVLAAKSDTLLLDKLSHASLIDGALHSAASMKRFAHNDIDALAKLLQQAPQSMVVTEGVFSMDGDSPDLAALHSLCQQHKVPLLLDDAHGLGVQGAESQGSAPAQGIENSELFCLMANFGKALGVAGAFLGAGKTVIDYIEQFGRHYIYSTGLSPALCAAVLKSIELCRSEHWRRDKLHSNIEKFRMLAADLPLMSSGTAIQGVILGSSEQAVNASSQLKKSGIWLTAIRPPTVPVGSARLRITLSSQHSDDDIAMLVKKLRRLSL